LANLTNIDASNTTGSVYITGAATTNDTNAVGTGLAGNNPFGLFGSAAGLLDDTGFTFGLKTFELGTGLDTLDASSATVAQFTNLVTTPAATVNPDNEIIVSDLVADTVLAATWAGIKGFSVLGDNFVSAVAVADIINMRTYRARLTTSSARLRRSGAPLSPSTIR
jgi:hypothetical protein